MGLLDRWSKKSETERLEKTSDKKTTVKAAEKTEEKKAPASKAKKTTAKTAAKKSTKTVVSEVVSENVETAEVKPAAKGKKFINAILLKALVTEKSAIGQSSNKYSFIIKNSANKAVVAKAVFDEYGVKPVKVNVVNVQGKAVRYGRSQGKRSDYKKAIVTLPKGKTIVIHEGV